MTRKTPKVTSIPLSRPSPAAGVLWKMAQLIGLAATLVLVAGLVFEPDLALFILWNVLIPLVPISLMVSPLIWRNVCPLSTLNLALNRGPTKRQLTNGLIGRATILSLALLVLLVPARRFLFNTDGTSLAVVIVVVALLALILGALFDTKAGFCNAICPVLPVERLYGQSPLVQVPNARCHACSLCTKRGCIDLAPEKSVAQTLGTARQSNAWLRTPFGIFAAAFPGFITAYYTQANVALASAGSVYLHVAAWTIGSYLAVSLLVAIFRFKSGSVVLLLGGLSLSLYYWFAVKVVLTAMGVTSTTWAMVARGAVLLAVGIWLAEALPKQLGARG